MSIRRLAASAALLAAAFLAPSVVQAQAGLLSSVQNVQLVANKLPTVDVVINSGSQISVFDLKDNAITAFDAPINVTTTWNVYNNTAVALVGYFGSPTQALTNGSEWLPSFVLEGSLNAGNFSPFTGSDIGGVAGTTNMFYTVGAIGSNKMGSRTDNLTLRVNLTGQPIVAAGAYAGTMYLRAVTF
jgi:hypothetical protein